jgi:hypothetical protein
MNDPGFDRQFTLDALGFCGKELEVPTSPFRVLTSDWQSTELLAGISPGNTSLALASDPSFQAIIRNDTESEYDANNFCTRLAERVAEGSLSLSPEFLKFEKAWRRDEMNHTLGFAMIESLLYGKTVGQIFEEIGSASPDFRPLEERGLLDDEFAVSIVIAYDEVSTALSYRDDFYNRYPKFDSPVLAEWIRRVASDEGHHFRNIVAVVKKNHAHRLPEVPALVRRILDWEESEHTYQRTFVLDHTGPQFTGGFISNAVSKLLKQFRYSLSDLPPSAHN